MFHGKPLNQSANTSQQQPQWPLNPQDYNNLRQSQNLSSKNIPVKFYLPDGEIRRSTIDTACNYQRITSFVKQYASVADKEVLLAWFDDQSEWIRFDTESEFTDAMNFARSLLNVPNSVFKIQAKVKKDVVLKKKQKPVTTAISQESVPTTQPIQPQPVPQQPIRPTQPVQQPIQPVLQQPQLQPQPVPQKPINQPMQPQMQPQIQPQQPINHPYYNPVQPVQSPFQPQFQPMAMNQPPMSMNQPSMVMNQPMPSLRGSPYTTPTKTLNSSVTMQQPHPLNSSFSSPQPTVQQQQHQQHQQQPQQPQQPQQQQPTVQQQQQPVATNDNNGEFDPTHISFLRDIGFGFDDAVLIKVLKEANGDVSVAAEKLLSYKQ